jgi:hypothetical protein
LSALTAIRTIDFPVTRQLRKHAMLGAWFLAGTRAMYRHRAGRKKWRPNLLLEVPQRVHNGFDWGGTTESGYLNRACHRRCQPFFNHQAQRVFCIHLIFLQPHSCWFYQAWLHSRRRSFGHRELCQLTQQELHAPNEARWLSSEFSCEFLTQYTSQGTASPTFERPGRIYAAGLAK